jgi:DNA-binding GntR family transcriptional regulator
MQQAAYAVDDRRREVEQDIIIELLRLGDGDFATHEQLKLRLRVGSTLISDALQRLRGRGVITVDGEHIKALDRIEAKQTLDMLAAVVVYSLVQAYPKVLTLPEVAKECERDLNRPDERHEIELALRWLTGDELASHREGWIATRPAVRAAELSF